MNQKTKIKIFKRMERLALYAEKKSKGVLQQLVMEIKTPEDAEKDLATTLRIYPKKET